MRKLCKFVNMQVVGQNNNSCVSAFPTNPNLTCPTDLFLQTYNLIEKRKSPL